MALSKRLSAIMKMVMPGSIPADVGCDHGLLSIELIQREICNKVYACDLREGPLSRAKKHIHEADFENQITTILTNGMDNLPNDCDTVIISGMGFETIKMILEAHMDKLDNYTKFIIQSNTDVDLLRKWISDHRFRIMEEDIVYEGHYYQIVSFEPFNGSMLNESEVLFGNLLSHPLFEAMWSFRLHKLKGVLASLPVNHPNVRFIENQINLIQKVIHEKDVE